MDLWQLCCQFHTLNEIKFCSARNAFVLELLSAHSAHSLRPNIALLASGEKAFGVTVCTFDLKTKLVVISPILMDFVLGFL